MAIKENVIKGWITTIIGTLTLLMTLFLWFVGMINMWPEGTAGIVLGALLVITPKTFESIATKIAGKIGLENKDDCPPKKVKPDNPGE